MRPNQPGLTLNRRCGDLRPTTRLRTTGTARCGGKPAASPGTPSGRARRSRSGCGWRSRASPRSGVAAARLACHALCSACCPLSTLQAPLHGRFFHILVSDLLSKCSHVQLLLALSDHICVQIHFRSFECPPLQCLTVASAPSQGHPREPAEAGHPPPAARRRRAVVCAAERSRCRDPGARVPRTRHPSHLALVCVNEEGRSSSTLTPEIGIGLSDETQER